MRKKTKLNLREISICKRNKGGSCRRFFSNYERNQEMSFVWGFRRNQQQLSRGDDIVLGVKNY